MKNILIIAKLTEFECENSTNRLCFLRYLEQYSNIMLLDDISTNNLEKWLNNKKYIFKPDIIIYYFLSKGNRFTKIALSDFDKTIRLNKIPVAMIFEDSHYTKIINYLYKYHNFQYFIQMGYNKSVINNLNQNKIPYKLWDQFVDINQFKDYDLKKNYDFLFYGYVDPNIYPLRSKIYNVLKELQLSHPHIRIRIIEHGSYNKNIISVPTQKDLANLINQSRFSFATKSIYDLLLKKYIEIPLSGSTIIGDIPSDYERLFKNKIIELKSHFSNNNIKQILLNAYNNKYDYIEKKTNILSKILRNNYSYQVGYNKLNCIVDDILKDSKDSNKKPKSNIKRHTFVFSINKYQ